jgi:hypothetical protein
MCNLTQLSVQDLLGLSGKISDELRHREILRSSNNPTGDYGEWLFSKAFGWTLEGNSNAGYDARDANNQRIQIKCRRVTQRNRSRLLSAIRNLNNDPFDVLAAVLLNEQFQVQRAAFIPIHVVKDRARPSAHVNGHKFHLHDVIWTLPGVDDVTEKLRAVTLP